MQMETGRKFVVQSVRFVPPNSGTIKPDEADRQSYTSRSLKDTP